MDLKSPGNLVYILGRTYLELGGSEYYKGGLAVAAAEMAFSGNVGLEIRLDKVARSSDLQRDDYILFSESNSRFLVEVPESKKEGFEELMRGTVYSLIGRTKKERSLSVYGLKGSKIVEVELNQLMDTWKRTLGD